jgi:hypothetical protein
MKLLYNYYNVFEKKLASKNKIKIELQKLENEKFVF